MTRIVDHKYTIEEAFREGFYIVPDYQREYVWTDKEIQQLLDDINDEIDAGSSHEYFIGTILVSPTDEKSRHEVIDGQQRLTTLFLLLCALRNRFQNEPQEQTINSLISTSYTTKQGDTATSLKLEPRYENAGEVMNKIVELAGEPDKTRAGIQAAGIKINTVGVNTSITRINQKLLSFTDWTAANIDERQDLLMSLAREVWTTAAIPIDE